MAHVITLQKGITRPVGQCGMFFLAVLNEWALAIGSISCPSPGSLKTDVLTSRGSCHTRVVLGVLDFMRYPLAQSHVHHKEVVTRPVDQCGRFLLAVLYESALPIGSIFCPSQGCGNQARLDTVEGSP